MSNKKEIGAVSGAYLGTAGYIIATKDIIPEGLILNAGVNALTGSTISKKSTSTIVGVGTGMGLYWLLTPKEKQNNRDLFVSAFVGGLVGFTTAYLAEQAS